MMRWLALDVSNDSGGVNATMLRMGKTCRILLAEDSPANQRQIAWILRQSGAEVSVADNGQAAVDLVAAAEHTDNAFDIVLTDIQMPIMDGYEAARQLRKTGCRMPIIAMTANEKGNHRQRCLDAGCDDYLTKPFDISTFETLAAKHLDGKSA
jgi:CheY-like chemotaxis protein